MEECDAELHMVVVGGGGSGGDIVTVIFIEYHVYFSSTGGCKCRTNNFFFMFCLAFVRF